MIQVLVIEDHHILQAGIKIMFNELKIKYSMHFVTNFIDALALLEKESIDLIILDLNIPNGSNTKMIEIIKVKYPKIKILVFSSLSETIYAQQCIRNGAHGFVSKAASEFEFKRAVEKVLKNQIYVSEQIQQNLLSAINDFNHEQDNNPIHTLSPRETDIINLIAQGKSTSEISNDLNLQSSTVSTYKKRIFKKLNVTNVVELINMINSFEGH